jgi:hypothetical protein
MQALRAGWSQEEIERATTHHGERFPLVDFIAESEQCPTCGSPMCIRKSRRHLRPVMSCEAGCFIPREVLKECSKDPAHPVARSQALTRIVRPRQHYAYDLVVQVGLARYLRHKHREEIRAELCKQHRIELSDGTVSILCNRFLSYLEALHFVRSPYLRAAMAPYGYPMHLDATNDQGKGGLFVTMDGFRGWVLVSGKIPSEHEDHIRPLIEKTVALFGAPIATMRDLLKAGPKSVASLREQGKPDLICHYHFLRAVGKKLFDKSHAALQAIMKLSGARTRLWELLRELRRYRKSDDYTQAGLVLVRYANTCSHWYIGFSKGTVKSGRLILSPFPNWISTIDVDRRWNGPNVGYPRLEPYRSDVPFVISKASCLASSGARVPLRWWETWSKPGSLLTN